MFALIAAPVLLQSDLQSDLTAILQDPALERAAVGVFVKELGGRVIYNSGGDKRLIPASALKLVTASYALDALGAEYPFVTSAWRTDKGICLKGGADPLLSIDDLHKLSLAGEGDTVFFDDSILGPDRVNGAWEYGDMMRSDAPPVSGLTVHGGWTHLAVINGVPKLVPRNYGMAIKRLTCDGEPTVRREFGSWTVTVSGKLPENDVSLEQVSLPDPALCAAMVIARKARRTKLGDVPKDAIQIRRPLAEVLSAMLKDSNNHAAETVLRLAGKADGGSGSWDDALKSQAEFLDRIGVQVFGQYRIVDGSGLARFNEITPRALVQVLEWSLSSDTASVFADAMCGPQEGTLSSRLAGIKVRAKTGTMTGVCSLAGYVETASGRKLLFALMFNHYDGAASGIRMIQDKIVGRLATELPLEHEGPQRSPYSRTLSQTSAAFCPTASEYSGSHRNLTRHSRPLAGRQ